MVSDCFHYTHHFLSESRIPAAIYFMARLSRCVLANVFGKFVVREFDVVRQAMLAGLLENERDGMMLELDLAMRAFPDEGSAKRDTVWITDCQHNLFFGVLFDCPILLVLALNLHKLADLPQLRVEITPANIKLERI